MSEEHLDNWDTRSRDAWDQKEILITCKICGTKFVQQKHNQLYDTKKCRKRAEYLTALEQSRIKAELKLKLLNKI